jgi:hypothetical protein
MLSAHQLFHLLQQLIMNVDCGNEVVCSKAGKQLFNSSSQTRLTDGLARNQVSMLPGTFQVSYGVLGPGFRLRVRVGH